MTFFSFFTKENVSDTLKKRISELEQRVNKLDNDYLAIIMEQKMLRDKVLRKIQFKTEPTEEPKDLYNGMFLKE